VAFHNQITNELLSYDDWGISGNDHIAPSEAQFEGMSLFFETRNCYPVGDLVNNIFTFLFAGLALALRLRKSHLAKG